MSSELLYALNPNIVNGRARPRPRDTAADFLAPPPPPHDYQEYEPYSPPLSAPRQPSLPPFSQQYVPHRSELEMAIVPPPRPPSQ